MQFIYGIFMFLSAYPMILSIRAKKKNTEKEEHHEIVRRLTSNADAPIDDAAGITKAPSNQSSKISIHQPTLSAQMLQRRTTSTRWGPSEVIENGYRRRVLIVEEEVTMASTEDANKKHGIFVQLVRAFTAELPFIAIITYIILIADQDLLEAKPEDLPGPWFNIYGVIFELQSAYGTVGLTLSEAAVSLSYYLHPLGKILIMV